jgi:hypothetical protein
MSPYFQRLPRKIHLISIKRRRKRNFPHSFLPGKASFNSSEMINFPPQSLLPVSVLYLCENELFEESETKQKKKAKEREDGNRIFMEIKLL